MYGRPMRPINLMRARLKALRLNGAIRASHNPQEQDTGRGPPKMPAENALANRTTDDGR